MPPKIRITQEQIINTSIRIVRERGIENLNARAIAEMIGCSVHPIFRVYKSMDGLKDEVYKETEKIYNEIMYEVMSDPDNRFLNIGLAYIEFAKKEKNLFKLLFMSDAFENKSMLEIVGSTEGDDEVLEMIGKMTGLGKQFSQELYAGVWLTAHGIASMYATNNCRFSDDETRRLLNNSFKGLMIKLKIEEEEK
ncbi:AcrR family transcriptional regulator [Kineothrix alysoides]|uniref:AcrR family transcriptional regulator n=1 Tax=Kineothrix alysoides TaxID=1469948 RepID=A0A4R1R6S3_9FIRM|nr:TetR/AcrR family transcriptional regulator [Kineothrix alysoides]TCL61169.1 AcrR family transcriptional regulator [Kineothrix alysoides]